MVSCTCSKHIFAKFNISFSCSIPGNKFFVFKIFYYFFFVCHYLIYIYILKYLFQKDQLFALELTLSILVNYCQKWFEYHPLPPLNILGITENILLRADPQLLNVFCERNITSIEYAWPLLQTTMSEVLSGDEWLILWDHLLSFQKPTLFLMCVIAYSIYSRNIIISTLQTTEDLKRFYKTQGHVKAKELLKIAQHLDKEIPYRLHPNRYLRNKLIQLPEEGPYPPLILEGYPKFVVEELNSSQLSKSQQKDHILHKYKQALLVEERRLHDARKTFIEEIHGSRLNEVKKCFQAQLHDKELEFKNLVEQMNEGISHNHVEKNVYDILSDVELETNSVDLEKKNCTKLQKDVARLENEVQNLLGTLRCHR